VNEVASGRQQGTESHSHSVFAVYFPECRVRPLDGMLFQTVKTVIIWSRLEGKKNVFCSVPCRTVECLDLFWVFQDIKSRITLKANVLFAVL